MIGIRTYRPTSVSRKIVFLIITQAMMIARSERQRYVIARLITLFSCSGRFLTYTLGGAMHVWTTTIAYHQSGLLSAAVTALLPGMAEAYWLIAISFKAGTLSNIYSFALVGLVFAFYSLSKLKPIDVHIGKW